MLLLLIVLLFYDYYYFALYSAGLPIPVTLASFHFILSWFGTNFVIDVHFLDLLNRIFGPLACLTHYIDILIELLAMTTITVEIVTMQWPNVQCSSD